MATQTQIEEPTPLVIDERTGHVVNMDPEDIQAARRAMGPDEPDQPGGFDFDYNEPPPRPYEQINKSDTGQPNQGDPPSEEDHHHRRRRTTHGRRRTTTMRRRRTTRRRTPRRRQHHGQIHRKPSKPVQRRQVKSRRIHPSMGNIRRSQRKSHSNEEQISKSYVIPHLRSRRPG